MKQSTLDRQAAANAELRSLYGDTVTFANLVEYKALTGIDPLWIRRTPANVVGRGVYRIPGGDAVTAPATVAPTTATVPSLRKFARRKNERAVIPTPFDDGAYDAPAAADASESDDNAVPVVDAPRPTDRPAPVMIHAWVCKNSVTHHCPGRKPGSFYGPDFTAPTCECGAEMVRHSWEKKVR